VRRIDQVLYDLIAEAKQSILLVAFAAYRVDHLNDHLAHAMKRGVRVTMLLESTEGSEGQLSADGVRAFRDIDLNAVKLLQWPTEKRERNAMGRPGKLHAKAAVIDDTALISSANFTDDAFNRNMELGVLLRDPSEVAHLVRHFEELERWARWWRCFNDRNRPIQASPAFPCPSTATTTAT
jgi:cardiolipin synthase